jgi:hypothetical protein
MTALSSRLIRLVLVGVVLDLVISVALSYQLVELHHTTAAARCWDRVFDQAVTVIQTTSEHSRLLAESARCAKLIP